MAAHKRYSGQTQLPEGRSARLRAAGRRAFGAIRRADRALGSPLGLPWLADPVASGLRRQIPWRQIGGRDAYRVPKFILLSHPFRAAQFGTCFLRLLPSISRLPLHGSHGFGAHDVDGGGVDRVLDVSGIVLLDHLDTGPAILRDLIDIRPFHQAQADIGVTQAVGGTGLPVAIEFQLLFHQQLVEHLRVPLREDRIGGLWQLYGQERIRIFLAPVPWLLTPRWLRPVEQTLIGPHRPRHALAVADTTLAPDLDLQDFFARRVIDRDRHVPMLQMPGFVRSQTGIAHEQDEVMKLLGVPLILPLAGMTRIFPAGLVEQLVLLRAEPGPMNDLGLGGVRR